MIPKPPLFQGTIHAAATPRKTVAEAVEIGIEIVVLHDKNLMMTVVLKIIKMYLKHGSSDASGWGFSGLSVVVLSGLKMQSKGMDLWKLTLELNKKTKSPLIKWRLMYLTSAFGNPWRIPFRDDFQNIVEP